ncbi:MAG: amidophosphoribosyltransferase [Planctomycetes bacterium]|nr:amidophosphoribosyltransferase [Planctomycetota bacterium]
MSDQINHYCGLAFVRLRQPLSYFCRRYRDPAWGLRKLYLLMEKQHNRGQDGAGVAVVKLDMPPGAEYIRRIRSDKHNALERIFDSVMEDVSAVSESELDDLTDTMLKRRCGFVGEVYSGHLRYGTHSGHDLANCHPYLRTNNIASRNLALAGNFNMTNARELFEQLLEYGLNPTGDSDTQVILERIGYCLDREHEYLTTTMGPESFAGLDGKDLARGISLELDLPRIIGKASENWDGGYVFVGLLGNGDAFVCRDPAGIRPAYYYMDEEVVAAASERSALASVFDVEPESVEAIAPAHVLAVKRSGRIDHVPFTRPLPTRSCSFERIYFSRGSDPAIYEERKALGRTLAPRVMAALDNDLEHAVFSYIPNTAEAAYIGLVEEIDRLSRRRRVDELASRLDEGTITRADLERLLDGRPRIEKVAHKDQRLRTFITHDAARKDLVAHIYDITRGVLGPQDTLVVVDDSIVRGTTLRESIITMLSRLNPRKIIIVSSSPPIMYPDCYGIDMSQLGRFIAFQAAAALVTDRGDEALFERIEQACRDQNEAGADRSINHVAAIYERFSLDEISAKIAELVHPPNLSWKGTVEIIYQSVDGLRAAIPDHAGVWYFTGEYPTPGGYKVLNRSYLNWRASVDDRAYELPAATPPDLLPVVESD